MYHMNKKQELNAFIKECITTALIGMMDRKAFDNITITELVKEAGVSRVSFYRNFESKKDVLEKYMDILINEWGKDFEEQNDPSYLSESLVRHYYKYKEFYSLLYKHDLSYMIYENLRKATKWMRHQIILSVMQSPLWREVFLGGLMSGSDWE